MSNLLTEEEMQRAIVDNLDLPMGEAVAKAQDIKTRKAVEEEICQFLILCRANALDIVKISDGSYKQALNSNRTNLHEWGSPKGLPRGWRSRILKEEK